MSITSVCNNSGWLSLDCLSAVAGVYNPPKVVSPASSTGGCYSREWKETDSGVAEAGPKSDLSSLPDSRRPDIKLAPDTKAWPDTKPWPDMTQTADLPKADMQQSDFVVVAPDASADLTKPDLYQPDAFVADMLLPDFISPDSGTASCKTVQIVPASGKKIYQGMFLGSSTVTDSQVNTIKTMSGVEMTVLLQFLAFKAIETGAHFPTAEADMMAKRGGAMAVKLEPWAWNSDPSLPSFCNTAYLPKDTIAGKHDAILDKHFTAAASFCKKWGKNARLYESYGHEMNGSWYPWGHPKCSLNSLNMAQYYYREGFKYVMNYAKKKGANCITWVYNPNVTYSGAPSYRNPSSYYPTHPGIKEIWLDGYNWTGTSTAASIFDYSLSVLSSYGKPLGIGEFACGTNTPSCWTDFGSYVQKKGLQTVFVFNKDKYEGGSWKYFAISTAAEKAAWKSALNPSNFAGTVQTKCQP